MAHGPQHPYNPYGLLGPAVSQPFLTENRRSVIGVDLIENSVFRQETVEERLDLTSYMSYMDAEGRG